MRSGAYRFVYSIRDDVFIVLSCASGIGATFTCMGITLSPSLPALAPYLRIAHSVAIRTFLAVQE